MISVKFVELINLHGQSYGIIASGGSKFLGMTWSAVVLLFLAVVITAVKLPTSAAVPAPGKEIESV